MSGSREGDTFLVREVTDDIVGETVVPGGTLTFSLSYVPAIAGNVKMYINGQKQKFGAGEDFTITGTTITWLPSADFPIEADDEIAFHYER